MRLDWHIFVGLNILESVKSHFDVSSESVGELEGIHCLLPLSLC